MTLRSLGVGLLLLCAIACASREEQVARHRERAAAYFAENRLVDALLELQNAYKLDGENAELNEQLATLLVTQNSPQAAGFHYAEAYRLNPSLVAAGLMAVELMLHTSPGRAEQKLAEIRATHPASAHIERIESLVAESLEEPERALAAAERAVELAREDPDTWLRLARARVAAIRLRSRDPTQALRSSDPEHTTLSPPSLDDAIAAFERADALRAGDIDARLEIAGLEALRPGRRDATVAAFRSAIDLATQAGDTSQRTAAATRLARYAARIGDKPLRVEALREVVSAVPEGIRMWEELAKASQWTEGKTAAWSVYDEMLAAQPDLPSALIAYTNALARDARTSEAIDHLERALERTKQHGDTSALLHEQRIRFELALERVADARTSLDELAKAHPDADETQRAYARLALHEKRYEDAVKRLRTLGNGVSPQTERLRALAERGAGNLNGARTAAERANRLSPGGDIAALRLKAEVEDAAHDHKAVLETLVSVERAGHPLTSKEKTLRARALYATGRRDEARRYLKPILEKRRVEPAAAVEFARREGKRDSAAAIRYLQRALKAAPINIAALEALTELEIETQQDKRALGRIDRIVDAQLAGPRVLLLRARVLMAQGELDRAEADALRAFENAPRLEGAVDLLFSLYRSQGTTDIARRSLREADALGLLHHGSRLLLARLERKHGEPEAAKRLYEAILQEEPGLTRAKHDLASLLVGEKRDLGRALELAEEAQREAPRDPASADVLGLVYLEQARPQEALVQFQASLERASEQGLVNPRLFHHQGLALEALGRRGEASEAFAKALTLDPTFEGANEAQRHTAPKPEAELDSPSETPDAT